MAAIAAAAAMCATLTACVVYAFDAVYTYTGIAAAAVVAVDDIAFSLNVLLHFIDAPCIHISKRRKSRSFGF